MFGVRIRTGVETQLDGATGRKRYRCVARLDGVDKTLAYVGDWHDDEDAAERQRAELSADMRKRVEELRRKGNPR